MKKYLELFKDGFDSTVAEKTEVKNWPYVGYSPSEGVVFTVIPEENQSGYQMVDLGLSVKWADRNVGASSPEDSGFFFSWGNVDGHAVDENGNTTDSYSFDGDTYSTTSGGQYTGSTLDAEHDAVTVHMGSDWRMPTVVETCELVENTDHYYIDLNGNVVAESDLSHSKKLRSICFVKKDEAFDYDNRSNFIEFPFTGHCMGSLLNSKEFVCNIWSGSLFESYIKWAHNMYFNTGGDLYGDDKYDRSYGRPVRGVHA